MINKHIIQEQAKEFTNRGDAFIHSEMKNGRKPETMLAGDIQGMIWLLNAEISRIAELSKRPKAEVIYLIAEADKFSFRKIMREDTAPRQYVEGEDYEETLADKAKENEKLKAEIERLQTVIKNLEGENVALANNINTLKKEHIKAIDNKIDELQQLKKEMRAMIHTLEELQKANEHH